MTKQKQENIIINCKLNAEIANEIMKKNQRSFNFTDLYFLLSRSIRNSIIRGWKLEFLKAFCLLIGILSLIIIYPNDIGSDPLCPIDVLNEFNITKITNQVSDFINGKRSNGELNVAYLILMLFYSTIVLNLSVIFSFPNEFRVSNLFNNLFINITLSYTKIPFILTFWSN